MHSVLWCLFAYIMLMIVRHMILQKHAETRLVCSLSPFIEVLFFPQHTNLWKAPETPQRRRGSMAVPFSPSPESGPSGTMSTSRASIHSLSFLKHESHSLPHQNAQQISTAFTMLLVRSFPWKNCTRPDVALNVDGEKCLAALCHSSAIALAQMRSANLFAGSAGALGSMMQKQSKTPRFSLIF